MTKTKRPADSSANNSRMNALQNCPSALFEQDLGRSWQAASIDGNRLDPFLFSNRIFAYKMMIEATNTDLIFGADNASNPLWGLAYQLQWQYSSGRLGENMPTDRIDPDSPWAYGNFTLSIIPFLGAVAAGVVPDLSIAEPDTACRFEYAYGPDSQSRQVPLDLLPAISDWQSYFELVSSAQPGSDLEYLRMALWKAHKTCLDLVADTIKPIEAAIYSPLEIKFLKGWCRMVDFLWAAAWKTDHDSTIRSGIDVLPHRPLTAADAENDFRDFSANARDNVRSVLDLADLSNFKHEFGLRLWKRAMRTRKARDEVEDLLSVSFDENAPFRQRMRLLKYMI